MMRFSLWAWMIIMGFGTRIGYTYAADESGANASAESLLLAPTTTESLLLAAAQAGHAPTVRSLARAGADVHATKRGGWTALLLASHAGHFEAVRALL